MEKHRPSLILTEKFNLKVPAVMSATFLINLLTAVYAAQLFSAGYPLGMDSFSHLPKLLYVAENGWSSWFFDWYAGMPFFLFYPPLAYMIAYLPTLLGLNPMLSYKLTEVLFILITPAVLYLFCRRLKLSGEQSAFAVLIFSLIPFVPLNSVVFGRFTNIVALPFYLTALIFFFEAIEKWSKRSMLLAGAFFALTLLTHHLSAYILVITVAILLLNVLVGKEGFKVKFKKVFSLGSPVVLGFILSSFWLLPFLLYLRYWHQVSFNPSSLYYIPVASVIFVLTVLGVSLLSGRLSKLNDFHSRVMLTWTILFFIYGAYFIPGSLLLPAGGEIDLMRFQFYASIPLSIVLVTREKYDFKGVSRRVFGEETLSTPFLIVLLLTVNVVAGASILASTPEVVAKEVDVGRIPPEIQSYLASRQDFGRVLAVDCPFWVYLLPYYTGKRLIDGWYPQGSILVMLKKVEKICTLNSCKDDKLIRHFIERAGDYGVKWVLIGKYGRHYLLENSSFKPVLEAEGITLYENTEQVTYVDASPPVEVSWSWSKDEIKLSLETSAEQTTIIVKEAYFPAWKAYDNGLKIPLEQSELGFMKFKVEGKGKHEIRIVFEDYDKKLSEKIKATMEKELERIKGISQLEPFAR
ncbi:MAG: hypothetical protein AYL30_003560 [Candidatus Hecatellales archaeon B24]|nr:MAG: hypothetical protein AYL30_003560 [Candidatus Hecatellales archaeon B24]